MCISPDACMEYTSNIILQSPKIFLKQYCVTARVYLTRYADKKSSSTRIRRWKRPLSLQRFLVSIPKRKIGRKAISIANRLLLLLSRVNQTEK